MTKHWTAIVAACAPKLGIGKNGTLPWVLPKEMKFFREATLSSSFIEDSNSNNNNINNKEKLKNAVVMGKNTWDSIPDKFKPLKGRKNIILSRSKEELINKINNKDVDVYSSISEAEENISKDKNIDRVFLIGGAELYTLAFNYLIKKEGEEKEIYLVDRVLLTHILHEFDTDVYLSGFTGNIIGTNNNSEWSKKNHNEIKKWTGLGNLQEVVNEDGVQYEHLMFTR